jgi:hypothetical protein
MVVTVRPPTAPGSGLKSRQPSQYVRRTTPIAARREGNTAVRTLTEPVGQDAIAMSQTARGGLTR